jgi:hypothetical protein
MQNRLSQGLNCAKRFFERPFWSDWRTITAVYACIPIIIGLLKWHKPNYTYHIYKSVFWNTIDQLSLYEFYDYLFGDCNHYGPVFAYVIAPFALLPDTWGMLLWECFLVAVFYIGVRYMPLERWQKVFMFWFCAHEVLTPLFVEQFDLAMAGMLLLTFACVEKQKPVWAAFFIMLALFIKLYGVMGFAFFFFIEDKKKFLLACLGWGLLFFAAPMAISSPEYVVRQYAGWYDSLVAKNVQNLTEHFNTTNTSLLGMPRKISGNTEYSDQWFIIPGILLFLLPFTRVDQYKHAAFRYAMLASVAMFHLLFSTGTESYGYIAAMTAFVVWYTTAPFQRGRWALYLLIYAFIFTSLCTSDVLFPRVIWKQWIEPYALKALPTTIVWFVLMWEMNTKDYAYAKERDIR